MSKYNWPDIFKTFEASGLSQNQFCQEQNINPKYFNLKFSQHRHKNNQGTPFAKAKITPKPESHSSGLMLEIGACKIHCPSTMPIDSFVSLVHALQ